MALRSNNTDKARSELDRQRKALTEWEQKLSAATAERTRLDNVSGESVLDDPASVERIATQMAELRGVEDLATKAIAAQRDRVGAAERDYLLAAAAEFDLKIAPAKKALAAHEARTAELLGLLEEHDGQYVHRYELEDLQDEINRLRNGGSHLDSTRLVYPPKRWKFAKAVRDAEQPGQILHALAVGSTPKLRNGETPADVYPACVWGPEAIVPSPAYVAEVERTRAQLTQLEASETKAQTQLAESESINAERGEFAPKVTTSAQRRILDRAPERRLDLRRRLAVLTGGSVDELSA